MAIRVIRFFQILLRFGIPLVPVVALSAGTYDHFHPWVLADAMVPSRPNQTRLLIGAGYSSQSTYAASANIIERSAEYVFYPEVLKTRESYLLLRRNDREPSVSTISFSPVLYILSMVFCVALSIAAWWLPLVKKRTGAHVA